MKKKLAQKLVLNKETLRTLETARLLEAAGANSVGPSGCCPTNIVTHGTCGPVCPYEH